MDNQYELKNDILVVAYFMRKNGWKAASKSNFQRVLYFAAVLSPTFLSNYEWSYSFANTFFGPVNRDLTAELEDLFAKGLLESIDRKIMLNRVEEKFLISNLGISVVENQFMKLDSILAKIKWLETIVKVLSIYEDNFISKLIKEDPNISFMNSGNQKRTIPIDDSKDNLSNELYKYLEELGKIELNLEKEADEEYLLLFFDLLYRKYKEETKDD
jgi:hypothetical protein